MRTILVCMLYGLWRTFYEKIEFTENKDHKDIRYILLEIKNELTGVCFDDVSAFLNKKQQNNRSSMKTFYASFTPYKLSNQIHDLMCEIHHYL